MKDRKNVLLKIVVAIAILAMAGCATTTDQDHPNQRNIVGAKVHADVLGVGGTLGGNLHITGNGGQYQQGSVQQQMMMRLFDPCDPGHQMSPRAWIQAPVNLAGRGRVNEQTQAYTGSSGRSCHWTGGSGTSYGPMSMGQQ